MPRKKKVKQVLQTINRPEPKPEDLEEFIREADEVKVLTTMRGWGIIARDLNEYRDGLINKLAYIDPKRPEHEEARILFIAVDKLFAIVNDYQENRDKAIELMNKLQNPELAVALDVDTE